VENGNPSTKIYYFPSFEELHNCKFSYNETGCSVFQNKLRKLFNDSDFNYFIVCNGVYGTTLFENFKNYDNIFLM